MRYPNLNRYLVLLLLLWSFGAAALFAADPPEAREIIKLYEQPATLPPTLLDRYVTAELEQQGLLLAPLCNDGVFMRRVYLDLTGSLPMPQDATQFLNSKKVDKREQLVRRLMESENYALYQSLRRGDALRIKSEFPVNLWPNAVQAYSQWVLDAMRENMPFDQFARALLTSSGSNFRNPPVNAELLAYRGRVFVESGYDLRELQRTIINSHPYQQSFIPQDGDWGTTESSFACYRVRRMDAEVLADALCEFTGTTESYMSMVLEPFTHIPASQRSIALSDGTIASHSLPYQ